MSWVIVALIKLFCCFWAHVWTGQSRSESDWLLDEFWVWTRLYLIIEVFPGDINPLCPEVFQEYWCVLIYKWIRLGCAALWRAWIKLIQCQMKNNLSSDTFYSAPQTFSKGAHEHGSECSCWSCFRFNYMHNSCFGYSVIFVYYSIY